MTETDIGFWRNYARVTAHNVGITADDLDDVEQDCMVALLNAWNKPQGKADDYYKVVIKNQALMWLRRERIRRHDPLPEEPILDDSMPEHVIVDHALCRQVIDSLNDKDREVITLYGAGWTDSQIAAHVGRRTDSIKVVIKRIRRNLLKECAIEPERRHAS